MLDCIIEISGSIAVDMFEWLRVETLTDGEDLDVNIQSASGQWVVGVKSDEIILDVSHMGHDHNLHQAPATQ